MKNSKRFWKALKVIFKMLQSILDTQKYEHYTGVSGILYKK